MRLGSTGCRTEVKGEALKCFRGGVFHERTVPLAHQSGASQDGQNQREFQGKARDVCAILNNACGVL